METLPTLAAALIPPCIAFVESFRALPFRAELARLQRNSIKSLAVIRSGNISEHWKEKVIPRYAGLIMRSSLLVGLFLALCAAAFTLTYLAVAYLLGYPPAQSLDVLFTVEAQLSALVVGSLYAVIRSRISASAITKSEDYSATSTLLHRLALQYRPVRELAFDLDSTLTGKVEPAGKAGPPVFVTGLARGGTTILLEALYSTGGFTTLTYRNMPFVTAPSLWPKVAAHFYRSADKKERAHGDRLEVDFDSPEAFEEVFWLTFSEPGYVGEKTLAFQGRNEELEARYRRYVQSILAASRHGEKASRYLAKNNNNLLRIELLKSAFPDATIFVPFRNPVDHASSLLRQHERFCEIHREKPFALSYMNWLGHHEFGLNIKPFEVNAKYRQSSVEEQRTLDFWLAYWVDLYQKLLEEHAGQLTFFNYDELCRSPEVQLEKLAPLIRAEPEKLRAFAPSILSARHHEPSSKPDSGVLERAKTVHERLVGLAL